MTDTMNDTKSYPRTAMRDAEGTPVFARETGEYTEKFPPEDIVVRAEEDPIVYKVYGFVGDNDDYEEVEATVPTKDAALTVATEWYGSTVHPGDRDGEVFEVEVHQVHPPKLYLTLDTTHPTGQELFDAHGEWVNGKPVLPEQYEPALSTCEECGADGLQGAYILANNDLHGTPLCKGCLTGAAWVADVFTNQYAVA